METIPSCDTGGQWGQDNTASLNTKQLEHMVSS
jgi:hypothetical protein